MWRLPDELRTIFKRPFGPVFTTDDLLKDLEGRHADVAAVGDVVARTLVENGRPPKLAVVDYRTKRGDEDASLRQALAGFGDRVVRVKNPPATVTKELADALDEALAADGTTRIEVDGEEDLAGLPLLAHAPLGTIVLYGMPNRGVVRVIVDETKRSLARDLLDKMRTE